MSSGRFITGRKRSLVILLAGLTSSAFGQATDAPLVAPTAVTSWHTGTKLRKQLESPVKMHWQGTSLRTALETLAATQRVAIFLDRRSDPNRPIALDIEQPSLQAALYQIADTCQLGVGRIGAVVYLGPPATALKLAALMDEQHRRVASLPAAQRDRWRRRARVQWPSLAEPQRLMADLEETAGIKLVNETRLPHDLWPAVDLPELDLVERCQLIVAGFGLTPQVSKDGQRMRWVPIPDQLSWEQRYDVETRASAAVQEWQASAPGTTLQLQGQNERGRRLLKVHASFEQHDQLQRRLAALVSSRPLPQPDAERRRYSLKVKEQPAMNVIESLATGMQLRVEVPPGLAERLRGRVSLQVTNAKFEQILDEVLTPLELRYRLNGDVLVIEDGQSRPAPSVPKVR